MAYITRRLAKRSSATEACSEIFERFGNRPISVRKQLLDANQVQQLSLTLGRAFLHNNLSIENNAPPQGTPIPPGYHLVYFTPTILEQELGKDGTDRTVNPVAPFTRRMWAGGELKWNQDPSQFLRVGQTVQETTKMLSAEPKTLKTGAEMLVVGVEKTYETRSGVALVDRRSWVYQKAITEKLEPPSKPQVKPFPKARYVRDFEQSLITLFRFSALTFNGHKIHYSPQWCRGVEGHRDCVVHGPLNLINMLDLWRDTVWNAGEGIVPKSISYRAMSPLYVSEPYRALLEKVEGEKGTSWKSEIWDSFGKQSMTGSIIE